MKSLSEIRESIIRIFLHHVDIALALFVFLFYLVFLLKVANMHYDGNVSGFLHIGTGVATDKEKCPDILAYVDPGVYIRKDSGYDGQYYYLMALDPFIRTEIYNCMDSGAYRYQRILLPLLASILSLGNRGMIPYAFLGIHLLSIVIGMWVVMKICKHFGISQVYGLFYAGSNGILLSLLRSTTEPLYLCMIVVASYYYLVRQDRFRTAIFLSFAVLTKEIALLTVGAFLLYDWLKEKQYRKSLYLLIPCLVYLLWQFYIRSHFHFFSFTVQSHAHFDAVKSFAGFFRRLYESFLFPQGLSLKKLYEPILLTNILFSMVLIVLNFPRTVSNLRSPFQISALLYSLVVLAVGFYPTHYIDYWGYGRHSLEILFSIFIFFVFQNKKIFLIPTVINTVLFFVLLCSQIIEF